MPGTEAQLDTQSPARAGADGSAKLSQEANQIGMTGIIGGAERVALTTGDGLLHVPQGLWDAAKHDWENPSEIAKTVLGSAAMAVAIKVVLPEAGPVGKIAGAAMGAWFIGSSVPGFYHAYKTGINANTWSEFNNSGKQWGDAAGQLGVNSALGYVGYKLGAGVSGRVLSSERFDDFADWKQGKWDFATNKAKSLLNIAPDAIVQTAHTLRMRPNYQVDGDRIPLTDTHKENFPSPIPEAADPNAQLTATVMLKGKATTLRMDRYIARMASGRETAFTDENNAFENKFGSSQQSLDTFKNFADQNHLTVEEADLRSGRVFVKGNISDMQNAFGVELRHFKSNNTGLDITSYQGDVTLPKDVAPEVRAVMLGDDAIPPAAPQFRVQMLDADGKMTDTPEPVTSEDAFLKKGGYLATDIAKAQNFPLGTGGEGQHGAFVSLEGGIDLADYNKFFAEHGLPQPKPLRLIEINGAKNTLGGAADTENALDGIQMQSIAPKADISMILGPNNIQGMADVYERAIFPRPGEAQNSVVSTSWGLAEHKNGTQLLNVLGTTFRQAALRGVQVFSGAGDNGARSLSNTYQPEYPAADLNVTGVGGLKMRLNADGSLAHVQVWDEGENSSTGGGISKIFSVPYWQKKLGMPNNVDTNQPGRGVPDISTNGAKSTGYPVRVGGENLVIGGTSAGAPLYAGLMLNINAELAALGIKPVSPLNPWMYARATDPNIFHDVIKGGNHGYNAGPGWDAASGLGWVDGTAMLNAMKENQTAKLPRTFSLLPPGLNMTQPVQQSSDHK